MLLQIKENLNKTYEGEEMTIDSEAFDVAANSIRNKGTLILWIRLASTKPDEVVELKNDWGRRNGISNLSAAFQELKTLRYLVPGTSPFYCFHLFPVSIGELEQVKARDYMNRRNNIANLI